MNSTNLTVIKEILTNSFGTRVPMPIRGKGYFTCLKCTQVFAETHDEVIKYGEHFISQHVAVKAIRIDGGISITEVTFEGFEGKGKYRCAFWQEKNGRRSAEGNPNMYRFYKFDKDKFEKMLKLKAELKALEESMVDLRRNK